MKTLSKIMRWLGPAATAGAVLAVLSDQLGLVTHLPEIGSDATGYHAVGSGLFLLILTLLLVGMAGLYARPNPDGPKVIEYGGARARYVLVEGPEEKPHPPGEHRPPFSAPERRQPRLAPRRGPAGVATIPRASRSRA